MSAMPLNRSNTKSVYRIVPGREAVTLKVLTAEGTFTSYSIATAKLNPWSTSLNGAQFEEQSEGQWVFWRVHLEAAGVPASSPKLGDQVVRANGEVWVWESALTNLFDNERSGRCRRLTVVGAA